jgi:flagellar biosynthesis/type III secretory pathway protein FliH
MKKSSSIQEAATLSFNKKIAFNEPPLRFSVKSISLPPVDAIKVDELIHSSSEDVKKKTEEVYLNKFNTFTKEYGSRIEEILSQINLKADQTLEELDSNLPLLVMEIVEKILPGIELQDHNVEQIVRALINEFSDKEEQLEVYLSVDDLKLLKAFKKADDSSSDADKPRQEEDGFASAIAGIFDNLDGNDALLPDLPHVKFIEDPSLQSGDCQVKSRFGLLDGRIATKVRKIKEEISGHG